MSQSFSYLLAADHVSEIDWMTWTIAMLVPTLTLFWTGVYAEAEESKLGGDRPPSYCSHWPSLLIEGALVGVVAVLTALATVTREADGDGALGLAPAIFVVLVGVVAVPMIAVGLLDLRRALLVDQHGGSVSLVGMRRNEDLKNLINPRLELFDRACAILLLYASIGLIGLALAHLTP